MKHLFFIFLFCSFFFESTSQNINLIPNQSFEEQQGCGINSGNFCGGFWYNPSSSSPDWKDTCLFGYNAFDSTGLKVRTGSGRVGGYFYQSPYVDARDYIAVTLKNTLQIGRNYCFKIHVMVSAGGKYGTNNLGAYFGQGNQFYNTSATIPVSPQIELPTTVNLTDVVNWYEFKGVYTASGNETDIIIGGFKTDVQSTLTFIHDSVFIPGFGNLATLDASYLVFEDVSLYEMKADAGNDTSMCAGDSLLIGEINTDTTFTDYYWYKNGVLTDSVKSKLMIHPTTTSAYVMEKRFSCGSVFDTLQVTVNCTVGLTKNPNTKSISIHPNPSTGDVFIANTGAQTKVEVEVYNVLGQKTLSQIYDAKEEIRLSGLNEGVYIVKIRIDAGNTQAERLIIAN